MKQTLFLADMWILKLLSRIPLHQLYRVSDFLFFIAFHVLRYRRMVVQQNLANSFPDRTSAELAKYERQFYKNLADYGVETLRLLSMPEEELKERMIFKNASIVKDHARQGQSILLLASHQFNWEWLLVSGSVSLGIPIDFVYQPQNSKLFNEFSLMSRTRFGAHAIRRETVGREAMKRKGIVRGTAIVADQFPGHSNFRRYWTTFLGQRTAFFQGISQLAVLTQSPAYYAAITKVKRGYYEVELIPIAVPPYDKKSSEVVIDNYVVQTEKVIRAHPEGWLWSHKRWKNID